MLLNCLYAQIKMIMYYFSPLARPSIKNDNSDITVKTESGCLSKELDLYKWNGNIA